MQAGTGIAELIALEISKKVSYKSLCALSYSFFLIRLVNVVPNSIGRGSEEYLACGFEGIDCQFP